MAGTTTDITAILADVSDAGFQSFCDGITAMFDADISCERRQAGMESTGALQGRFKKLAAIHLVAADGALTGTIPLLFDQGGLFVLSGVIVMLPESRILDQVRRGSIEDAKNLQDAAGEVGNLLVGAWDTLFREQLPGHKHFVKKATLIGKPSEKLGEMGLALNSQMLSVVYEMKVGPYPSFLCAAVFPPQVLASFSLPAAESAEPVAASEPAAAPASPPPAAPAVKTPSPAVAATAAPTPVAPAAVPTQPVAPAAKPEPAAPVQAQPVQAAAPVQSQPVQPTVVAKPPPAAPPSPAVAPAVAVSPSPAQPAPAAPSMATIAEELFAKAIVAPAQSDVTVAAASPAPVAVAAAPVTAAPIAPPAVSGVQTSGALAELLATRAADIMSTDVVWATPEDTVQTVLSKMQQHDTGYVLIGANGTLEGLVSNSTILGAVSLYLRPVFAKWRRPDDDATLGVKVKWIMSRPVRTVRPETTLEAMIECLRRYGGRCLPVADEKGAVKGIVTVFDILIAVLASNNKDLSWKGRPPQAPALLL